jgi:hypothetical protein
MHACRKDTKNRHAQGRLRFLNALPRRVPVRCHCRLKEKYLKYIETGTQLRGPSSATSCAVDDYLASLEAFCCRAGVLHNRRMPVGPASRAATAAPCEGQHA